MKKSILIIAAIFSLAPLFAQDFVLHDPVSRRVFNSDKYSSVNGSPFLYDKWINAAVTTDKGTYQKVQVKLDSYENILFFNKDDQPYEFEYIVKSFVLKPNETDSSTHMRFRNGIYGGGLSSGQFVQVLAEGKVALYKSHIKLLSEMNEVNRGVVKTFNTSVRYFLVRENLVQMVKINKKEVLPFFQDNAAQVEEFLKNNKNSLKREADLVGLINYFNSL